jgi:predicted phage gp36 major capsid-like protein
MDKGENMENARYAMNDNTAGFINQMKNRNTSRKIE